MRSRKTLTALVLAAASMSLVASPASASSCANAGVEAPLLSQNQIESSVTCIVNEERTTRGLSGLVPNDDLRRAGARHSNDMVSESFFAHTSPGGITFLDRIEATGYMLGARSWSVGENLVWGTGTYSTPDSMVRSWMNSPPHRENILNGEFREIGVAAVRGTPERTSDPLGITVSSEFGARAGKGKKKRGKRRGKARKSKQRHRRAQR